MLARDLEADVARAAATKFGVPTDAAIEFVTYRENHVYRVRAEGLDLALRLHRPGYRTDQDLCAEVETMAAFRAAGLAVPAPRRTIDGDECAVLIDALGMRRQATMLGWFDGTSPIGDSAAMLLGQQRPTGLCELGRLMAELHETAAGFDPSLGAHRPAWDAAGLAGPAALWGSATRSRDLDDAGRAVLTEAEARLSVRLAELPRSRDRFGCIHADLTLENVLAGPDGLVIIDFDDFGHGWYLFDLATTFFWCTMHPEAEELLAELVSGYREVRAITPADAAAWHALLLARGLSYLGWSADRPGGPVSEFHEATLLPWVLQAARRWLASDSTGWPSLADFVGPTKGRGAA